MSVSSSRGGNGLNPNLLLRSEYLLAEDTFIRQRSHHEREQIVEVLLGARDLIAEDGHWCQGGDALSGPVPTIVATVMAGSDAKVAYPLSSTGMMPHPVDPRSEKGVTFCARGAMQHSAWEVFGCTVHYTVEESICYEGAMRMFSIACGGMEVVAFNDSFAKAARMVVDVFDRAAMLLKDTL